MQLKNIKKNKKTPVPPEIKMRKKKPQHFRGPTKREIKEMCDLDFQTQTRLERVGNEQVDARLEQFKVNLEFYKIAIPKQVVICAVRYLQGFSVSEIGQSLETKSYGDIYNYLQTIQGHPPKYWKKINQGKSWYTPFCEPNAPNLFVNIQLPRKKRINRKNRRDNPDDLEIIENLLRNGYGFKKIDELYNKNSRLTLAIQKYIYPKFATEIKKTGLDIYKPETMPKGSKKRKQCLREMHQQVKKLINLEKNVFQAVRRYMVKGSVISLYQSEIKQAQRIFLNGGGVAEIIIKIGRQNWNKIRGTVYQNLP